MTDDELKALAGAEAAMTPTPWQLLQSSAGVYIEGGDKQWVYDSADGLWRNWNDLDGVIALRNAAPRLLATIAQQRAIIATLRAAAGRLEQKKNAR